MKCNIGKKDKMIRITAGIVIIGLGLYFKSWWGLVGLIPVITAVVNFCPAYVPLGVSTCEAKSEDMKEVKKQTKK